MRHVLLAIAFVAGLTAELPAQTAPVPKPALKITPGKVIVPTDRMRRMWGELISLDLKTRTGKFRSEGDDMVRSFIVMPYAELLHHAAFGDLQDYRVGERAIFRLHENDAGEWVYLTYIQDEMNFYHNHKEFLHVDAIDPKTNRLDCTQGSFDKSYIRDKGILVDVDAKTRYWKNGEPAKFADIRLGDKLQTQSHGIGKGRERVCWEVFLDSESLVKFQMAQRPIHAQRMLEEGLPGYVDRAEGAELTLTLFHEGEEFSKKLKVGQKIRVAPTGVDRKPMGEPIQGTVTAAKMDRNLGKVVLSISPSAIGFQPAGLARLWVEK